MNLLNWLKNKHNRHRHKQKRKERGLIYLSQGLKKKPKKNQKFLPVEKGLESCKKN